MNEQTKLGIHSEGILFTLKREEILSHVITWMNFEDIMLSKPVIKRQILYDTTYMTYLSVKFRETKQNGGYQGLGGGRGDSC